jgi:uncharacterized membrane-anchored protein YitT (DUF2179 family)
MSKKLHRNKSIFFYLKSLLGISVGSFLFSVAIVYFLAPHKLIDGGIIGVAMITSQLFGKEFLSPAIIIFNLPFLYLGYKQLGKTFVIQMFFALALSSIFCHLLEAHPLTLQYQNFDMFETIIIGGVILGMGIGLIIRQGGALDGTEILAILINKYKGFTVGQVVFFFNIFIFIAAAFAFNDWRIAFQSLMVYLVVIKVMDTVIVGLEDTKAAMIITRHPRDVGEALTKELGLGLTILYGKGGFSGTKKEILYIIVERLQLAELRETVGRIDPQAFVAISNLHEVFYGTSQPILNYKKE